MYTVFSDISSCVRYFIMRTSRCFARSSPSDDGLSQRGMRHSWTMVLASPSCLDDLSVYIICVLTYSPTRAIYMASLTLARHLRSCMSACEHLDYGRVLRFHRKASIAKHTTFTWYVNILQLSRRCPCFDRVTAVLCFRLSELW